MMLEYNRAIRVQLDDEALNNAIEAATEAAVAGDDEQAQITFAIQVYLETFHCKGSALEIYYKQEN